MKIAVCSDIHLEFGELEIKNTEGIDVLILAGDICVASLFTSPVYTDVADKVFRPFFKMCSEQFKHVIFIMGNHEHYKGDFSKTYDILKDELKDLKNIYLLEKEKVVIDGVLFIGQTLWTDFNKQCPITMQHAESRMNDYRVIKNSAHSRKLSALDTFYDHKNALDKISEFYDESEGMPVVVVGHHAPSSMSIKPTYERDRYMNGAYNSSLENFILDRPRIKLWIHGHTHSCFDYMVGDTRVVCNPRGYVGIERDSFEPYYPQVIELEVDSMLSKQGDLFS